ncbi:MAG: LPS export ABC transporter periplasmic protein LptC [Candidatus Rokubacteria bacterium RIFCSPLOWO2_02_FULL_68_19]|nr:MAG: LPS export ABC transporter periplasmic protein LptC [Candidatus Rokubacteria bacterium RIFCSPLOWO2_02_FULL_68_19]
MLTGSDGLRLETTTLRWQAKERRVWTNDPVTIFRDGAVIQGQGLEAWMADERTQVKGRLRATFAERPPERSR